MDAPDKTPREFPFIPGVPGKFDDNCWTWKTWEGFMKRVRVDDFGNPQPAYYTPGDPKTDGDAGGYPGYWLNYDAQQNLVQLIRKSDGMGIHPVTRAEQGTTVQYPYMVKREVPSVCPSPSPSPNPSPSPGCPIPQSCPNLITWGVGTVKNGVRNCAYMGANHVPTDGPVAGGFAVCDSTPRFGASLPGKPCNADSHAVCSASCGSWRECEDPRGPEWDIDGPCELKEKDGFHAKIKLHGPGTCTATAYHPNHPVDALGKPVTVDGFTPGWFSFNIH